MPSTISSIVLSEVRDIFLIIARVP